MGHASAVLLVAALPLALFAALLLHDYHAYPGGDVSTVGTSPCGGG